MKRSLKALAAAVLALLILLPCIGCEGTVSVGAYYPGPWAGPYGAYGGGVYVGGSVPIW